MKKLVMAVLAVLVMASAAYAAYPAGHPCVATQKLDVLTGVVTTVNPEQKAALGEGALASADPMLVASARDRVVSADAAQCPASYFGAQDADRRVEPESNGEGATGGGNGDSN